MKKNCLICKKEFIKRSKASKKQWEAQKYCSVKCTNTAFKDYPTHFLGKHHSEETKKKLSDANMGRPSPRKGKKYPQFSGENHWRWKGDKASYGAKHMWIYKQKGKASYCSFDPDHVNRDYDWANVSGSYLRDTDDYISLCATCHWQYDWIRNGKPSHARNEKGQFMNKIGGGQ